MWKKPSNHQVVNKTGDFLTRWAMTENMLFHGHECLWWLQLSRGKRAGLWYPSSQVQTRPKRSDFSGEKILSAPSFGGEVKPTVPCCKFTACKWNPKVTWKSPLSAKFSAISRPSFHLLLLGFAHVVSDVRDTWWWELECSNHWSSRLGGLTCRWQRHSVKTFLLRILNDSWAGQNPQGLQCRLKKNAYDKG